MPNYKEVVKGRIVSKTSGPVAGAEVKVYDKNLLVDDHLGTATTGADGSFEVDFKWSDYKHNPFENRPDIFLRVRDPSTGNTTKTRVWDELEGQLTADDSVEVMDLGDVPVD